MQILQKKKKERKSCFEFMSVCYKASGIVWPLDVMKSNWATGKWDWRLWGLTHQSHTCVLWGPEVQSWDFGLVLQDCWVFPGPGEAAIWHIPLQIH